MPHALTIVKQFFPKVTKVRDADEPINIEVTKRDCNSSRVRNHNECALAVACKRVAKADGVIVSVSTAYVVNGDTATRYHLPPSVSREIVSFDRNGGFDVGKYRLNVPHKSVRLGAEKSHKGHKTSGPRNSKLKDSFRHYTENVRAALAGRRAPDGVVATHAA